MKRYCFDTSGLSNPLETMPRDIYVSLWDDILDYISKGYVGVTKEIFDEMVYIPSGVGEFIKNNPEFVLLEVGDSDWDWESYLDHNINAQDNYRLYISEHNNNIKGTVGLNDLSIISLAKTLGVPLLNMETFISEDSPNKRRIPNICNYEDIESLTFNDFLRKESLKF